MYARAAIALGMALALAGCKNMFSAHKPPETIETASFDKSLQVDLKSSTKLPSGLYYRDLVVGTGPEVTPGSRLSASYVGWLANGTQFDASPAGSPYQFTVGAHQVIDGWDLGVVGMHVGGKRQLILPAALGYGDRGSGPIPPDAILVFVVEAVALN